MDRYVTIRYPVETHHGALGGPKSWRLTENNRGPVLHDADMKLCLDTFKVDVSGNTTYTGITIPTPTTNVTWPGENTNITNITNGDGGEGGLSLSDKIALGVGIGFGVPTVLVGLGAWLCARKRRRPESKEPEDLSDSG